MILAIFLTSLLLTLFCLKGKRNWKDRNDKSIRFFFFDKSFEFLASLTAVALFYTVLWLLVNRTTDETTLWRLEKLEGAFDFVKWVLSYVNFKPWTAALIIAALIAVDLILSRFFRASDAASRYKDYHKWSKRVYTVAVLLCSFTFFGNQTGEQRAGLRLRTDSIRTGYALIEEAAEEELSAAARQEVYDKVVSSLPPEVKEGLDYPEDLDRALAALRAAYEAAREYGIGDARAADLLRRYGERAQRTPNFPDQPVKYDAPDPGRAAKPGDGRTPAEAKPEGRAAAKSSRAKLTVNSVKKALSNLEARKNFRARSVSLLGRDSSKQLLVQFPKSLTNLAKSVAFEALIKRYPFLEPVIDVFVGTFDKRVEEAVRAGAKNVADALIENPEKAKDVVAQEARKIADSAEVKATDPALDKARKAAGEANRELKEIRAAEQKVSSSLETRRQQEEAIRQAEEERQREEIIECSCVCSRDGIARYQGTMSRGACEARCSGPC